MSEHHEQAAFVAWWELSYPQHMIYAIPNGGHRHIAVAVKLKKEGVKKGVSDLFVLSCKLYIEMKASHKERLTKEQKDFRDYALMQGYNFFTGHGFDDAVKKALYFMGLNNPIGQNIDLFF